jgi:hypothetical protein
MDRITHQSPRQRGYGSTSSLRNDPLKHTRKHERRKGGIEPRNKALRLWRTVRPAAVDRPKTQTELLETTSNNGPSAGSTQTVRQAPADRLPGTRGPSETSPNENLKPRRIETKGEQEHEEHPTNRCRQSRKCTTSKVNFPNPSPDLPNGRSC